MSYYDHAVMMRYRLGPFAENPEQSDHINGALTEFSAAKKSRVTGLMKRFVSTIAFAWRSSNRTPAASIDTA
ncbi:MAG: hypothetical protein AAF468_05315 [Pseudomonadota bacterium]